jgi:hypothetical protein
MAFDGASAVVSRLPQFRFEDPNHAVFRRRKVGLELGLSVR